MSAANGKKIPASLEFDALAPIRIPVRIGDRHFVLRQAMAGDVILYRNFIIRTAKVDAASRTASTQGYADSEAYLLSLCLFEVIEGKERRVDSALIKTWPNDILKKLFSTLEQISDMVEDEEESMSLEELVARRDALDRKIQAREQGKTAEEQAKAEREELVKN